MGWLAWALSRAARIIPVRWRLPPDNEIKALTVEQARELAARDGDLWLDGLTSLSPEIAAALSRHKKALGLNGLSTLSPEVAGALAGHEGILGLNGLTSLGDAAAKELARHRGKLGLEGLATLSDAAAEALGHHEGGLGLDGLTSLSPEAARGLSRQQGELVLRGVKTLSDEAAQALGQHTGSLFLDGLATLSTKAAEGLSHNEGVLSLTGLATLSAEAAGALAKHQGNLFLDGLPSLSADAALALADHKSPLILNGLKRLSPEVATALARHEGDLLLHGLKTLPDDAANALAQHTGRMSLQAVTALSKEAAATLRHNPKILLPNELVTLSLLARYKEILAAILPPRYLADDGLLRLPSGKGEQVQIEWDPWPTSANDRRAGSIDHIMDRPLMHRLRECQDDIGAENLTAIQTFLADRYGGRRTSRIVLKRLDESTFVHEVFHDIQAYLYDHHVDVHEALAKAVRNKKPEIIGLYDELESMPRSGNRIVFVSNHRWMFSYLPKQLFPEFLGDKPYGHVYEPVVERFGWQTLFKIHGPVYEATVDLSHQEVIPTLLAGVTCGDRRVDPILQDIFRAAGLNEDFAHRLRNSPSGSALPAWDTSSAVAPEEPSADAAIETPVQSVMVQDGSPYPSLPDPAVPPRHRVRDAWQCRECSGPGFHIVISNNLYLAFINKDWNTRPVAVDAVACPKHWHTAAVFPLLLTDTTVAALGDRGAFLARCGYFDGAEGLLRRALNARPADVTVRVRLAHVILDHMKLARLLGTDAAANYPRDRSTCSCQVRELLESLRSLEATPHAVTLVAHARLALEAGDVATATGFLEEARQSGTADEARAEREACATDLQLVAARRPPSDGAGGAIG